MALLNQGPSFQSDSMNLPSNQSVSENKAKDASYAAVAQNDQFPKTNQGLIMDCVEGLELTDYTTAVGDIVEPKSIIFSSRISKNRICLYLTSSQLVDDLTDKIEFLIIKGKKVTIRPLITKLKRVIISNVAPPIPHYKLADALSALDIKCVSPFTILKAAINKEGYSHVLSSRRQTYINPNDAVKLPEFLKIDFEGTAYYVYPSINTTIKCFLCKVEGHIARHCPSLSQQSDSQGHINAISMENDNITQNFEAKVNSEIPATSSSEKSINENILHTDAVPGTHTDTGTQILLSTGSKRLRTHSTSTNSSQNLAEKDIEVVNEKNEKTKKVVKKVKKAITIDSTALKENLIPALKYITENASKYPVDYDSMSKFLEESYGKSNISEIASKYTTDIQAFTIMLADIHDNILDRNLKHRINRIIKRLNDTQYVSTDEEAAEEAE